MERNKYGLPRENSEDRASNVKKFQFFPSEGKTIPAYQGPTLDYETVGILTGMQFHISRFYKKKKKVQWKNRWPEEPWLFRSVHTADTVPEPTVP